MSDESKSSNELPEEEEVGTPPLLKHVTYHTTGVLSRSLPDLNKTSILVPKASSDGTTDEYTPREPVF